MELVTDAQILSAVALAFASVGRPEHFTNHMHCCECWEHDQLLGERDLDTIQIRDVGSQAWNPITMTTPRGFAYFMPALARLALAPLPEGWDWYGYIILFELRWNGPRNERWQYCTSEQRRAVCSLLEHLCNTRQDEITLYNCSYELMEALEIWLDSGDPPNEAPSLVR
jgi:hypothetical protein